VKHLYEENHKEKVKEKKHHPKLVTGAHTSPLEFRTFRTIILGDYITPHSERIMQIGLVWL